jgi:hypothetical protein
VERRISFHGATAIAEQRGNRPRRKKLDMAAQRKLDRKAWTAITIAGALLLAVPLSMIGKIVAAKIAERSEQQVFHPENDQLVLLRDGSTMLVKHSSARRIADWLALDATGQETFQIGNGNFASGSATLTRDGWEHLAQFAHMLRVHPGVSAVVVFSPSHGDRATVPLEHLRADRIHDEAVKRGVDEQRIAVVQQGFEPHHNAARDEGLEVVLTNRG